MEARVAKLESDVAHIRDDVAAIRADLRDMRKEQREDYRSLELLHRTDYRILFGAIFTVALGLAGLMAKGFHWL